MEIYYNLKLKSTSWCAGIIRAVNMAQNSGNDESLPYEHNLNLCAVQDYVQTTINLVGRWIYPRRNERI